jgi:hypothetical protein
MKSLVKCKIFSQTTLYENKEVHVREMVVSSIKLLEIGFFVRITTGFDVVCEILRCHVDYNSADSISSQSYNESRSGVVETQLASTSSKHSMQMAGGIISRRLRTGNGICGRTLCNKRKVLRLASRSSFLTSPNTFLCTEFLTVLHVLHVAARQFTF